MINRRKLSFIISIFVLLSILITACDGVGGSAGDNTGWSDDQDPITPIAGGGADPGEELEEPEEPEEPEEGGEEDEPPIPITNCSRAVGSFWVDLKIEELVWEGPPEVHINSVGYYMPLVYEFFPSHGQGQLQLEFMPQQEVDITVIWPDCRSTPFEATTSFTPEVDGMCLDNQIDLTVMEHWKSVTLEIPCEKDSDICGDDPCVVPYPLPFALAGAKGITVRYYLEKEEGKYHCDPPEGHPLPFLGVGASGTKTIKLDCD